jgi:hypothetical protein
MTIITLLIATLLILAIYVFAIRSIFHHNRRHGRGPARPHHRRHWHT